MFINSYRKNTTSGEQPFSFLRKSLKSFSTFFAIQWCQRQERNGANDVREGPAKSYFLTSFVLQTAIVLFNYKISRPFFAKALFFDWLGTLFRAHKDRPTDYSEVLVSKLMTKHLVLLERPSLIIWLRRRPVQKIVLWCHCYRFI